MRLIARFEDGVIDGTAVADLFERARETARTAVRLEREAVTRGKISPHALWIQAHGPQILLADSRLRPLLDLRDQPRHPGRLILASHGFALETGPVAREHGFLRRRKELDVLRLRFPGVTRRPAEDSGRPNAQIEEAVVRRVGTQVGAFHFLPRRHGQQLKLFGRDNGHDVLLNHDRMLPARRQAPPPEIMHSIRHRLCFGLK